MKGWHWVVVAGLYMLALPVFLVRWLLGLPRMINTIDTIQRGWVDCRHCGTRNVLNRLSECPSCGRREYGSVLACNCGARFFAIQCDGCGVTISI